MSEAHSGPDAYRFVSALVPQSGSKIEDAVLGPTFWGTSRQVISGLLSKRSESERGAHAGVQSAVKNRLSWRAWNALGRTSEMRSLIRRAVVRLDEASDQAFAAGAVLARISARLLVTAVLIL